MRNALWPLAIASSVGAAYFAQRFPDHRTAPVFALVGVVAIALPSLVATVRWLGKRRGVALLLTLTLMAYAVESFGLMTGWPYGAFEYGAGFGPKIGGVVPVLLPFAYVPLVLGALSAACRVRFRNRMKWLAAGVLVLVAADLVLDPGAVAMGFWSYSGGGIYYDVPLSNYMGWLLSGSLAMALSRYWLAPVCDDGCVPPAMLSFGAVITLAFWAGIAVWLGLWIPAIVGAAVVVVLVPVPAR